MLLKFKIVSLSKFVRVHDEPTRAWQVQNLIEEWIILQIVNDEMSDFVVAARLDGTSTGNNEGGHTYDLDRKFSNWLRKSNRKQSPGSPFFSSTTRAV